MVAQQFPDRCRQGSIGNDPQLTVRAVIFSAMTWFIQHCGRLTMALFPLCGHNLLYVVIITILPTIAHGQQSIAAVNTRLSADRLTGSAVHPRCKICLILHTPPGHDSLYIEASTPRYVAECRANCSISCQPAEL